ncbi:TetR/AcrR family transcriptional regulator [Streptomyces sp. NBC_01264]|uniref:TetR/AcrR family transcriptional regulator n=1 Tax=Streptomyces sp. NBC_01264 TaxID=2903804 RepID=UPI00224CB94F|nr:TetR/AcrR family transcriptional regulator [Streptomyces sp. NBC_01264]MCX4781712.1 TetR family transcriptional regulator [Streptomyces sp. NBC_01264]
MTDSADVEGLAARAVDRSLAERSRASARDVRRLVEAAYTVVERTGALDLTMRDLLREAGMSNQAFYRYFRSKDDLFIAMLDDGRRRMTAHLRRRMARAQTPAEAVRAWVEGVLAQADDHRSAARTRPFLAHADRLAARFPEEQSASEQAMIEPLAEALIADAARRTPPRAHAARDARTVYLLAVAALHQHLRAGTAATREDTDYLVAFVLGGLDASAQADAAGGPWHVAGP